MPLTVNDVLFGFVIPLVIAAVIDRSVARPGNFAALRNIAANLGLAAGFVAGVWLLKLSPLRPTAHWHYLPYIAMVAAIAAIVGGAWGPFARSVTAAVVLGATAYLLVPTWDDLKPTRMVLIVGWAVAAFGLDTLTSALPSRHSPKVIAAIGIATAFGVASLMLMAGSLRFAQFGGCMAAVFCGLALSRWRLSRSKESAISAQPSSWPEISLIFVCLAAGVTLVGQLNSFSDVPLLCYVLVPLAPLGLWVSAVPVSQCCSQKVLDRIGIGVSLLLLTVSLGVAAARTLSSE